MKKEKEEIDVWFLKTDPTSFTHWVTSLFPTLSEKIRIATCTIDSKYPWCNDLPAYIKSQLPQNWIYQNLVKTCENQSPFIGRCRYTWF